MVRILGISCLHKRKWSHLRLSIERKLKITHWLYLNLLTKGNYSHLIKFNIPRKYKRQVQRIRKRSPGFSRLSNKNSWRLIRRVHFILKHYWAQESRGIRITKDLVKIRITNTRDTPEAYVLKSKKGYFAKTAITLNFIWPNSTYIVKWFTFNLLRLINIPLMYYDRNALNSYFSENIPDLVSIKAKSVVLQKDLDISKVRLNESSLDLELLRINQLLDILYINFFSNKNLKGDYHVSALLFYLKNNESVDYSEHLDILIKWQSILHLNLDESILLHKFKTYYQEGIETVIKDFINNLVKDWKNLKLDENNNVSNIFGKAYFEKLLQVYISIHDNYANSIIKKIMVDYIGSFNIVDTDVSSIMASSININDFGDADFEDEISDSESSDSEIESDDDWDVEIDEENEAFDDIDTDFDYTGGISKLLTPLEEEHDDWI